MGQYTPFFHATEQFTVTHVAYIGKKPICLAAEKKIPPPLPQDAVATQIQFLGHIARTVSDRKMRLVSSEPQHTSSYMTLIDILALK